MNKQCLIWMSALVLGCVVQAKDTLNICSLNPGSPATLDAGDRIAVKVGYKVDSADSARIFVRPYTKGKKTRGYGAHPSSRYSGCGEMEGWFTFSGEAKVDEIRVEMLSLDNKRLATASIPVELTWRVGNSDSAPKPFENAAKPDKCTISNIRHLPASPAVLDHGDRVAVMYEYAIEGGDGVHIQLHPYNKGKRNLGFEHNGHIITGSGTGKAMLRMTDDARCQPIDEIRLVVKSADCVSIIKEFPIKVDYRLASDEEHDPTRESPEKAVPPSKCTITNLKYVPSSPATLAFGEMIHITYDYEVVGGDGVRIQSLPYLNGKVNKAYACNGSYILQGKGSGKAFFSIRDVPQGKPEVDEFRLVVESADWKTPVDEISVKVDYRFSEDGK